MSLIKKSNELVIPTTVKMMIYTVRLVWENQQWH